MRRDGDLGPGARAILSTREPATRGRCRTSPAAPARAMRTPAETLGRLTEKFGEAIAAVINILDPGRDRDRRRCREHRSDLYDDRTREAIRRHLFNPDAAHRASAPDARRQRRRLRCSAAPAEPCHPEGARALEGRTASRRIARPRGHVHPERQRRDLLESDRGQNSLRCHHSRSLVAAAPRDDSVAMFCVRLRRARTAPARSVFRSSESRNRYCAVLDVVVSAFVRRYRNSCPS